MTNKEELIRNTVSEAIANNKKVVLLTPAGHMIGTVINDLGQNPIVHLQKVMIPDSHLSTIKEMFIFYDDIVSIAIY